MKLKSTFDNLKDNYLFARIGEKTRAFAEEDPSAKIINMGIGDVTLPLPKSIIEAGHSAIEDLGKGASFRGYGPYEGYDFLRSAVAHYYNRRGLDISAGEVYISSGAKDDMAAFSDIFDMANTVLITDPVYPAYLDTNIMDGRKIVLAGAGEDSGFLPQPDPETSCDIIYICSPNNPTGAVMDKETLTMWVKYATACGAVILFDAAYEAFIRDKNLPHSIFEIPGAEKCAVEFGSFSKTAGFTGVRCGYLIIPRELDQIARHLRRRQASKYNGASYISQKMAAAALSAGGLSEIRDNIDYYMKNAAIIAEKLDTLRIKYYGGINSPYIWLKCGGSSWKFFDRLLRKYHIAGTPGAGFGENGEGWFRLTAFGSRENTVEAARRLDNNLLEY